MIDNTLLDLFNDYKLDLTKQYDMDILRGLGMRLEDLYYLADANRLIPPVEARELLFRGTPETVLRERLLATIILLSWEAPLRLLSRNHNLSMRYILDINEAIGKGDTSLPIVRELIDTIFKTPVSRVVNNNLFTKE